jgi:hypothetical protein
MKLSTDDLLETLVDDVPHVGILRDRQPELWNEKPPNNYAVFSEVVRPYVLQLLQTPANEDELHRVFLFFEKMVEAESFALLDLLQVEIIEPISRNKRVREQALPYAGDRVKKLMNENAKWRLGPWVANLFSRFIHPGGGKKSQR